MTPAERQRRSRYAGHGSAKEMDKAIAKLEHEERAAAWPKLRERGYHPCPHCGEPVAIVANDDGELGLISDKPPPVIIHRRSVRDLRKAGAFQTNKQTGAPTMMAMKATSDYYDKHPGRVGGPQWREKRQREHEKNIVTRLPRRAVRA